MKRVFTDPIKAPFDPVNLKKKKKTVEKCSEV